MLRVVAAEGGFCLKVLCMWQLGKPNLFPEHSGLLQSERDQKATVDPWIAAQVLLFEITVC